MHSPDPQESLSRLVVQELPGDQNDWSRAGKGKMKRGGRLEVTVDQTLWILEPVG